MVWALNSIVGRFVVAGTGPGVAKNLGEKV